MSDDIAGLLQERGDQGGSLTGQSIVRLHGGIDDMPASRRATPLPVY
jgi:hypothetical protein